MKLDLLCHIWTILLVHNIVSVKTRPLADNFKSNKTSQTDVNTQENSLHSLPQKGNNFHSVDFKKIDKEMKTRLKRKISDILQTGTTDFYLSDKPVTHIESSSNTNYGLDVSQDLPKDDKVAWKEFSMYSDNVTPKANPVDRDNGKEISETYANTEGRKVQKTNKDQRNISYLQLVLSTSIPGENFISEHTPRLVFPFKKNPQPQQSKTKKKQCRDCTFVFIPKFENNDKNVPILPEVNLNIVPLGAILTFIFILCCKCFSWALEDIREWDEHHVQVIRPKHAHSKNDDYCFENQMSSSSSSRRKSVKRKQKRRIPNLWRKSSCRVEPEVGTLEYIASIGLLPGMALRPKRFEREDDDEVVWPVSLEGTSPVAGASLAAAMAANIPMCIACTTRQLSNESRASSNRSSRRASKAERRTSQQQIRRKSKATGGTDRPNSRPSTRSNSRSSSRSGSKTSLKFSSSHSSIRHQRQILAHLADMSCSAPYIPDSVLSLSSEGDVSRSSSCAESIPFMRTKSAKSSAAVKIDSASVARQQWHRAALLLQQTGGQRRAASRHRSTGSTGTSRSGSAQSSQATSLSSLRLLSQTTGSTSNVDSALTSQTNLTSDAGSEANTGHNTTTVDVYQYTLPKPTWPTTLELRGSYYEDPMFIDWGYLQPTGQHRISPKCSPNSLNVESRKSSGRVSDLSSLQNSANVSENNLNYEASESDHSAPSSPTSSSRGSMSSSLSETTISQIQNSEKEYTKSSSNDSNNTDKQENFITVITEKYGESSETENHEQGKEESSETVIQTRSKSADELEAKTKKETNTKLGIYNSATDTSDNQNDIIEDNEPLLRIAMLKSKMSLPLVKVSDKNYTYLRPRSKTFSHLHKNGGVDGRELLAKLNDIVKHEDLIEDEKNEQRTMTVINDDGDMETSLIT